MDTDALPDDETETESEMVIEADDDTADVFVTEYVAVGVALGVMLVVGVGDVVAEEELLRESVGLVVPLSVAVTEDVGDIVSVVDTVAVGVPLAESVGLVVSVVVGDGDREDVGETEGEEPMERVDVGVDAADGVLLLVGVPLPVVVGVTEGVPVAVNEVVIDGVTEGVTVGLGDGVKLDDGVPVGDAPTDSVDVGVLDSDGGKPSTGVFSLRAGTLDDTSWVQPVGDTYTRSAQPWVHFVDGGLQAETLPPDFSPFVAAFRAQGRF